MTSFGLHLLLGALAGAGLGYFGQCSSGTCPLTSTWWRGALYGAVLGSLIYYTSGRSLGSTVSQSKNVVSVAESQFAAEVTGVSLPVVVDFYAPWCGPCRTLSPMIDQLADQWAGKVKFVKVNVDEAPALASRYGVQGVPTLVFLREGKVTDSLVGVPPRSTLESRIRSLAADPASAPVAPKE